MHIPAVPTMDPSANLLGALVLALDDAQMAAMEAAYGPGASATPALVELGEHTGLSVAGLSAFPGLSHSATVRLADDLERRGLLQRGPGADRQSVGQTLTEQAIRPSARAMKRGPKR